jgi:hypothetical protein
VVKGFESRTFPARNRQLVFRYHRLSLLVGPAQS